MIDFFVRVLDLMTDLGLLIGLGPLINIDPLNDPSLSICFVPLHSRQSPEKTPPNLAFGFTTGEKFE